MLTLQGRTMVITGGAGNNGLAIVRSVIEQGMKVAFFSSSLKKGQGAVDALEPEYRAHAVGLSADESGYDAALAAVAARFGSVDVLVNAAGPHESFTLEDTDEARYDGNQRLLKTAFFTVRHALPYLERSRAARIINLTTAEGRQGGWRPAAAQACARGGLISLTYALARELGGRGITANCVCIAPIEGDVPAHDTLPDDARARLTAMTPLGRLGEPRDIVSAVEFLASEESAFVTGAVIDVSGGLVMG